MSPVVIPSFNIARLPRIHFGAGSVNGVPDLIAGYGSQALIVTGQHSLEASPVWSPLVEALGTRNIAWHRATISGEPSPEMVDDAVRRYHEHDIDVVVAIGGGSVVDAGKAIAGLMPHGSSVLDYLEDVGANRPYYGPATPFIAVPTTAGTGSEATKNAVISIQGENGFKKSFRHEDLVPAHAVVDPDLLATCPPALIAANGMDALTQLIESYVSSRANPFTDALALSGIEAVRSGLFPFWHGREPEAAQGRGAMAYAALLSGITLAQVGLGSVHGLASPLGAFFPIPHGVVCGTLIATATATNIAALRKSAPRHPALEKYAHLGKLLSAAKAASRDSACEALVTILDRWTRRLELPRLSAYGITDNDVEKIVANCRGSSMKTNPVVLKDDEVAELVRKRL